VSLSICTPVHPALAWLSCSMLWKGRGGGRAILGLERCLAGAHQLPECEPQGAFVHHAPGIMTSVTNACQRPCKSVQQAQSCFLLDT
jgi:hypothetical protein